MHKVVIVGGGFAGVKAALELVNIEGFTITLISNKSNFEYHAALYRTATGRSPKEVALPINHLLRSAKNVNFVIDEIVKINTEKQCVSGTSGEYYEYDSLLMCIGLTANYYGIKGLAEEAFSLDTITHTIELRKHLHDMVVKDTKDSHSFVVVGAGASGTELAAEIGGYLQQLAKFHRREKSKVHVTLIEGSDRVLPLLSPRISKRALKKLKKRGVVVHLSKQVSSYEKNILSFSGQKIRTETLIWTAGSKNNPLFAKFDHIFVLAKNGRVQVNEFLAAQKNIYVLGDNAASKYSGMAQTALYDAHFVTHNLKRTQRGLKPIKYQPRKPIYAVPIGGHQALIQWGHIILTGYPAWLIRRIADFRLFREFEPLREAVQSWRAGNRKAQTMACDICSPDMD